MRAALTLVTAMLLFAPPANGQALKPGAWVGVVYNAAGERIPVRLQVDRSGSFLSIILVTLAEGRPYWLANRHQVGDTLFFTWNTDPEQACRLVRQRITAPSPAFRTVADR